MDRNQCRKPMPLRSASEGSEQSKQLIHTVASEWITDIYSLYSCGSTSSELPSDCENSMQVRRPKVPPPSASDGATVGVGFSSGSAVTALTIATDILGSLALMSPGTILGGRYKLLKLIGEGGMGAVYKARDIEVDRLVALKVIRPQLASNPEVLQRFKQELVVARQITHKNVVRIYDIGDADGVKFITMEYVDGEDLKSILRSAGKFPPWEAVSMMQQICRALDACHSEGVIHRDLKPSNVMRDALGKVVVMAFGLARSAQTGGLTETGAIMGTLEYMSPEQAKGQDLDTTSDIYAAGLMFYALLTGKL